MKRFLFPLIGALVMATGCARFNTTQRDLSYDEQGNPAREITTRATAYTFFAGKSSLASWKASQTDKTQGASVGNLTQEANAGTNLTALVETVIGAAVRAAIRP